MAECRSCGKEIPEGTLYCNECEARMKADESYLDSLLSSVVANSAESILERPVRKTTAEPVTTVFPSKEEPQELQDSFVIEELDTLYAEANDVIQSTDATGEEPEYELYDIAEETVGYEQSESAEETVEYEQSESAEETVEYEQSESAAENLEFDLYESVNEENEYNIFGDTDDSFLDDLFVQNIEESTFEEHEISPEDELLGDLLRTIDGADEYELDLEGLQADAAAYENEWQTDAFEEETDAFAMPETSESEQESADDASVASEFESYDEALDAEATLMGEALAEEVFATEEDVFGMLASENTATESVEDDPFAMLGLADEPVDVQESFAQGGSDDVMDIWSLMNSDTATSADGNGTEDSFGDFSELFGEDNGYMNIPEAATDEKAEPTEETPKKKKKKNIFKRIFGNVREDLTEEEIEERKRKALEKFEEDVQKAAEDAARAKQNKEEKAKRKEEEAAQKQEEKELLARKKAEEKRAKAEEKRLLKDKKEQAKRALLAEIEENEGKINKFGASVIIVMFAAILCLITIGTSYYNYKISIDKAQFDFDLQRYDDAYNDVYGLEIKEEDMELYDKIMTVQYVNVQLLSYMRYHSLDMDAEALDSLIKGLRRYEKFIQHGTKLGVKKDLNYLKTQIVEQLDEVFGIDEATAYEMLALETQEEYSVQIYDIVSKKN